MLLKISCTDPTKLRFENSTNKKTLKQAWRFFLIALFIRDLERIRTSNPQSRNLIFYPVELRGHKFLQKQESYFIFFYTNFAFTIIEMVFPSAFPANSLETMPMTLPISFIPSAPVCSMVITTTFSISSSLRASGKN
jgi:hypothetical protein